MNYENRIMELGPGVGFIMMVAVFFFSVGCEDDSSSSKETDGGTDADTDSDSDADSDADADSDSDSDSDSDVDTDADTDDGCPRQIEVKYYDFAVEDNHPDFHCNEHGTGITTGLILPTLDGDRKPIYNPNPPATTGGSNPMITSAESFHDWFHDTAANVVSTGVIPLEEYPLGSGIFRYASNDHVIVPEEGGFTTEIHSEFLYKTGQIFRFLGDDDVWVFINDELVVDIGGLHQDEEGSVALDDLGLTPGETYPIDMFHAERCYPVSHFTLETSIDCFSSVIVK